jgi:5,10-methenyltetrahydrofolate synthetase
MNRPKSSGGQEESAAQRRKALRARLLAAREALSEDERAEMSARIAERLGALLGDVVGRTIAVYWPMRGEPDLSPWIGTAVARGATFALPVMVAVGEPLVFRAWAPGDRVEPDRWGIAGPVDGAEVRPDVVIVPLVGFDRAGYRIGYGGGYYDRTLAALTPRPRTIGVGYACAEVDSIEPQSHDVPLDAIVTEAEAISARDLLYVS